MASKIVFAFPVIVYVILDLCSRYASGSLQNPKGNTVSEISHVTLSERHRTMNYLFILFDAEKELGEMFIRGIQQFDESGNEVTEAQLERKGNELRQTKSVINKLDLLIAKLLRTVYTTKPQGISEGDNHSMNTHADQHNKTDINIIKKPSQAKTEEISKDADLEPLPPVNETLPILADQMLSNHIADTLNATKHLAQLRNGHDVAVTKMHSLMRDLKQQDQYRRHQAFPMFMRRLPKAMGTSLVEKSSDRKDGVTLLRYG